MGILNNLRINGIKIEECGEILEEVISDEFVLEPMYFKWGLCEDRIIKLRSGVIERLKKAKKILNSKDGCEKWNFKIWDGYRILSTQKRLYDDYFFLLKEKHPELADSEIDLKVQIFVSPPSKDKKLPAPHNTGGAVDLTIIDENFKELEMGSAFDEFNIRSFTKHFSANIDDISEMDEVVEQYSDVECVGFHRNRMLLNDVMEEVGFVNYHEEWWHFSFGDQAWALQTGRKTARYGSMEL